MISLVGLAAAVVFATLYLFAMGADSRGSILGPAGRVWIGVLVLGIATQAGAWVMQRRLEDFKVAYLIAISTGCAVTLLATASLREVIRLTHVDLAVVAAHTAEAAKVQGFVVFVVFAALCVGLIGYCVWLVRQGLKSGEEVRGIQREGNAGRE